MCVMVGGEARDKHDREPSVTSARGHSLTSDSIGSDKLMIVTRRGSNTPMARLDVSFRIVRAQYCKRSYCSDKREGVK